MGLIGWVEDKDHLDSFAETVATIGQSGPLEWNRIGEFYFGNLPDQAAPAEKLKRAARERAALVCCFARPLGRLWNHLVQLGVPAIGLNDAYRQNDRHFHRGTVVLCGREPPLADCVHYSLREGTVRGGFDADA